MNKKWINWRINWRSLLFIVAVALIAGCAQLGYYVQAMQGQFSLLSGARPIDEWLADPGVADTLKHRLARVKEIRQFAADELGLPDNQSYTNYADLKRPYVLWNVVAAPEFSLDPVQWCFPIAGCVNYRGYYSKSDAQSFGAKLRRQGYDVQIAGVPAYSTLGWFNDPVLSTFIRYPDGELARLVFHELAHQVAYAQDDTKFNESFAVAVEEVGVARWMAKHGDEKMRSSYAAYEVRKRDFLALLLKYRDRLEDNYASPDSAALKRSRKAQAFQELKDDYRVLQVAWGGFAGYDRWFAEPLSNAHLSSIATYHDFVPGFRALLTQKQDLAHFYEAVRTLSVLDKDARHGHLTELARLGEPAPVAVNTPATPTVGDRAIIIQ